MFLPRVVLRDIPRSDEEKQNVVGVEAMMVDVWKRWWEALPIFGDPVPHDAKEGNGSSW